MVGTKYGKKVERITAFTEFFGPSSFAGNHEFGEQKQLKLFDVSVYKKGILPPREFVQLFEKYDWAAEVMYEGNINRQFIDDVRTGKYDVVEGVVCKGIDWTAKIKTEAFLDRLKQKYEADWEKYTDDC